MKQSLFINWNNKYSCPGGDCGLTCCTADWKIALSDEEIEGYKKMEHPFRDEMVSGIDEEKKAMLCRDGKCVLLNENGYCKLVINCGAQALSRTCSVFPWNERDYGIAGEAVVEIVCPIVAEFLFESEQLYFLSAEVDDDESGTTEDANTYLALFQARTLIMDIFSLCPQKYIHGKAFILLKIIEKIDSLIKEDAFNVDNVKMVAEEYSSENVIAKLFDQCDIFGEKVMVKEKIMYQTLLELNDMLLLSTVLLFVTKHKDYVSKQINRYIKSEVDFNESFTKYVDYIKSEYPMLSENFILYSVVCNFVTNNKSKFSHKLMGRFIELLMIHICGMAILDEYNKIDPKDFSVIIAAIDRVVAHDKKIHELLYDYCVKKIADNQAFFMMLIV